MRRQSILPFCHFVIGFSMPQSFLPTALVLHSHGGVSNAEAKNRADYDLCWKVALGTEVSERPSAKSTLQPP